MLMSARTAMQHVRNDQALSNLHRRWQVIADRAAEQKARPEEQEDPAIVQDAGAPYEQLVPSRTGGPSQWDVITCVSFVYQGETPLSWQLSPAEIVEVRQWWGDRYGEGEEQPISLELRTVREWLAGPDDDEGDG